MLTLIFSDLPAFVIKHAVKKRDQLLQPVREFFNFKTKLIWRTVIMFAFLHVMAVYGLYLMFFVGTWKTMLWTFLLGILSFLGLTGGAHRLWAHSAYTANLPLKIIWMLLHTLVFEKTIIEWVRDHRCHHKFTHTDGDPHNPERGYFFAHIGWMLLKKHKEVLEKGKGIDLSDVKSEPVLQFQRKYYFRLTAVITFLIPAMVPYYFWGEDLWVCWCTPTFTRIAFTLNHTLFANSLAHFWGSRPFDVNMGPCDNGFVSFLTLGEGWHNFHHVFPWDYKTGQLGGFKGYALNITSMAIDFFWAIGWATDLKVVSPELVEKRRQRTGGHTNYDYRPHLHRQVLPRECWDAVRALKAEEVQNREPEEVESCNKED